MVDELLLQRDKVGCLLRRPGQLGSAARFVSFCFYLAAKLAWIPAMVGARLLRHRAMAVPSD